MPAIRYPHDCQPEEIHHFRKLNGSCVCHINNVLVPHLEFGRKEITLGMARVHVVDLEECVQRREFATLLGGGVAAASSPPSCQKT